MHKQSKIKNSFTTFHQQADVQPSPGKQSSIMDHVLVGKTNTITLNVLLPSFFPWVLLLSTMSYGMGFSFGQLGSAVPAVSPPSLLRNPSERSRKCHDTV